MEDIEAKFESEKKVMEAKMESMRKEMKVRVEAVETKNDLIIKTIREQKVKLQKKESEMVILKNKLEMKNEEIQIEKATFETEKKKIEANFESEKKDIEAKFESEKKIMEAKMESMKAKFESDFESKSKKPGVEELEEENSRMQLHEDLYLSSSEDEMNIDSSHDIITHNKMAEIIKNKSLEVHQLTLQVNCYKSLVKKLRDQAQVLYKENSDQKRYIANMEAKSREETPSATRPRK